MADDRKARISYLRLRIQQLRADFAFVEGGYKAGRISLADQVAQIAQITDETNILVNEYTALIAEG